MAKLTTKSVITEAKPILVIGTEMVTVIASKNAKYLKIGSEHEVTAQLAQTLINKGEAHLKK